MFGHRGQGHLKRSGQLRYRQLAQGQAGQDGATGLIGQRAEGGAQAGPGMLNHMV